MFNHKSRSIVPVLSATLAVATSIFLLGNVDGVPMLVTLRPAFTKSLISALAIISCTERGRLAYFNKLVIELEHIDSWFGYGYFCDIIHNELFGIRCIATSFQFDSCMGLLTVGEKGPFALGIK